MRKFLPRPAPVVAAVFALGILLRALTALSPQGFFNSDEATTGLTSLSVLRLEFPLVVPGNDYGGVFEAYLLAPFVLAVRLLGLEEWGPRALDAVNICMHTALFAFLYILLKRLSTQTVALLLIIPSWLLSASIIRLGTETYLGYVAGPAACIGSIWLSVSGERATSQRAAQRNYFGAAFLAGVAFWQHPLASFLPLSALGWLFLTALVKPGSGAPSRLQALRSWFIIGVAFLLGVLPAALRLFLRRDDLRLATSPNPQPLATRLRYILSDHVPSSLGLRPAQSDWPLAAMSVVVPVALVAVILWASVRCFRKGPRCLTALPFGLLFVGASSATSYVSDGRYAIFFTPPLLILVAAAIGDNKPKLSSQPSPPQRATWAVRSGLAALCVLIAAAGWYNLKPGLTNFSAHSDPEALKIVRYLDDRKVTNVRGEYWIAYRIGFITSERIATTDFVNKRFDRLERRVATSAPEQLAWISRIDATQPAEVVDNPDWPTVDIGVYRIYTYKSSAS
jgi:hypothetical protein